LQLDCTFLQTQHQSKCRISAGFLRTNGTPCNTGCPVFVFVCMCVRVVSLRHLVDVQTFPDLRRCYVPEVLAQVAVVNYVVCICKAVMFCPNSRTREPDLPHVLSPSSILLPRSCHCAFCPAGKNLAPVRNVTI
jgi:hypothetical protein